MRRKRRAVTVCYNENSPWTTKIDADNDIQARHGDGGIEVRVGEFLNKPPVKVVDMTEEFF